MLRRKKVGGDPRTGAGRSSADQASLPAAVARCLAHAPTGIS